jgi:hypothetical protein
VLEALRSVMPGVTEDIAGAWWRIGWTPATIDHLAALGRAMHERNALGLRDATTSFRRLVGLGSGGRPPEARLLPWVALFAGAPDEQSARGLEHSLRDDIDGMHGSGWLGLGRVGVLGYAAGLTLTETEEVGDDADAVARLRTLAGLRGWDVTLIA